MSNLFDIIKSGEQQIKPGVIARTQFEEGYCGVLDIYIHNEAKLKRNKDKNKIYVVDLKGKRWLGAFENADYPYKELQPYDRFGNSAYFPMRFKDLDEFPTSNEGSFLSGNSVYNINIFFPITKDEQEGDITMSFEEENVSKKLSNYLKQILPRMGVPKIDTETIVEDIFKKLGYSKIGN